MTSAIHIEPLNCEQILAFITINIVMISIWSNEAYYYNKYGDSRIRYIYSVIILMLWVGNLALNINFNLEVLANNQLTVISFNSFLILAYLTIALQYYLKGRKLGFNRVMKFHIRLLAYLFYLPSATSNHSDTFFPFCVSSLLSSSDFAPLFQKRTLHRTLQFRSLSGAQATLDNPYF